MPTLLLMVDKLQSRLAERGLELRAKQREARDATAAMAEVSHEVARVRSAAAALPAARDGLDEAKDALGERERELERKTREIARLRALLSSESKDPAVLLSALNEEGAGRDKHEREREAQQRERRQQERELARLIAFCGGFERG